MAAQVNWDELLEKKYPSYTVEVQAFLDTCDISRSTDVSIVNIYKKIQNDSQVNSDLKILYHECIHGTNKDVKLRIRNRIANFRWSLRY